jgi:small-conductance mechanosensitive channel
VYLEKIKLSVTKFRHDRSPEVLWTNAGYSLLVIVVTGFLIWGVIRLFRWLDGLATRHVQRNIDKLASKSHHLISGAQVWGLFAGFLRMLKILSVILLVYFLLNTVLGLFPWTRPLALILFSLVLNPLESIFNGFIEAIPDLAFLLVLFLIVRYILKLIRIFFQRVEKGYIKLENFDHDWAMPTFKILRLLIIAFSIVIAYPYIPGSDSSAFKGISVFIGIIFSLGSSSFIAGMIAGLTMTYRGAFKEGDLVKIGDITGVVTDIRLMITRVRTAKNEIVVIPNTTILNCNVINYSTMARESKLILHTIVGIGYDTPWRQVEALLLLAAERSEGLLQDPPPFVLQKQLGDFAVNYELNAFCRKDFSMLQAYSNMHANIQDVFNEHGVQIMSPAYEADTAEPKIVPKENWYTAPARAPTKAAEDTGQ